MNIVFCCDRRMTAALHVAALSVLEHLGSDGGEPVFWVFSDDLEESDLVSLGQTLASTDRGFSLRAERIDSAGLENFPRLSGSLAAYYRLLVPERIPCDRYLYLDVDTLCKVDLCPLLQEDMGNSPIGLCPEGPISSSADQKIAALLGAGVRGDYFNSGVMLVNTDAWRRADVTVNCLEFLETTLVDYHDQSAMNHVLHGRIHPLPIRYNCYTNVRTNWPALKPPSCGEGRLLHFVDFPKPWSPGGRWMHPFGPKWWRAYQNTNHYLASPRQRIPGRFSIRQWPGYKKAIKDRILFQGYSDGWLRRVKGVPLDAES